MKQPPFFFGDGPDALFEENLRSKFATLYNDPEATPQVFVGEYNVRNATSERPLVERRFDHIAKELGIDEDVWRSEEAQELRLDPCSSVNGIDSKRFSTSAATQFGRYVTEQTVTAVECLCLNPSAEKDWVSALMVFAGRYATLHVSMHALIIQTNLVANHTLRRIDAPSTFLSGSFAVQLNP